MTAGLVYFLLFAVSYPIHLISYISPLQSLSMFVLSLLILMWHLTALWTTYIQSLTVQVTHFIQHMFNIMQDVTLVSSLFSWRKHLLNSSETSLVLHNCTSPSIPHITITCSMSKSVYAICLSIICQGGLYLTRVITVSLLWNLYPYFR